MLFEPFILRFLTVQRLHFLCQKKFQVNTSGGILVYFSLATSWDLKQMLFEPFNSAILIEHLSFFNCPKITLFMSEKKFKSIPLEVF